MNLIKPAFLTFIAIGLYSISYSGELEQLVTQRDVDHVEYSQQTPIVPSKQSTYDLCLSADFIYWGVNLGNLGIAQSGYGLNVSSTGTTKSISTSWDPGFKVGAQAFFHHDNWDMKFNYTRVTSSEEQVVGSGYFPLWNIGNIVGVDTTMTAGGISAQFKQSFNALDINLGRICAVSRYLTIRPFFGLQGIYMTDHFNVEDLNVSTATILTQNTNLNMQMKQFSWGIGIEAGMDTMWYFCPSFGLYGNFMLSGLSSRFDTTREDFLSYVGAPNTSYQLVNTNSTFYTVKAYFDLALGLAYEYHGESWGFHAKAGWEAIVGMDFNQFIYLSSPWSNQGDLTMQGLTVELGFSF